jgi:hypothetical protein
VTLLLDRIGRTERLLEMSYGTHEATEYLREVTLFGLVADLFPRASDRQAFSQASPDLQTVAGYVEEE